MAFIEMNFASGGSSTPFQFSTDEQKTNCKWLDGKDIYCKTVSLSLTADHTSTTTVSHGIANIEKVVAYDAILFRTGTSTANVYGNTYYGSSDYLYFAISPTSIVYINRNYRGTEYITVYYTKTS